MKRPIPKYAYPEQLLIDRMKDCKTIEELTEVGAFYNDMQKENLITITNKMRMFCMVKQQEIIYNDKLNNKKP